MNRRLIYSLALLLIGAGLAIKLEFVSKVEVQGNSQPQPLSNESANNNSIESSSPQAPSHRPTDHQNVEQLATQIGKITNNPDEISRQLQHYADQLSPSEILDLKHQALTEKINMDVRFMCVELIGLSARSQVRTQALSEIAMSPWSEGKNPTLTDYEKVLRAQAIEHLYNSKSQQELLRISHSTPSPFLKDRALRSISALKGKGPSPEEQDRSALGELLKPTK